MKNIISTENTVLIVEDSVSTRVSIAKYLTEAGICNKIIEAGDGIEALNCLTSNIIDLIICDIMMPKMDGFKFLMVLNNSETLKDIPVILLSQANEVSRKVKGFEIGAWDFIAKPFEKDEFIARAKNMMRIKTLQDNLKMKMRELELLSIIDPLTGLYNKKYLFEYMEREFEKCRRAGSELMLGCIIVDIDHFKDINDTYGHVVGDLVLKKVGYIFNYFLRGYDFVARYGGDEFIVIMSMKNTESLKSVSERIREALDGFDFNKNEKLIQNLQVTCSVGTSVFPLDAAATPEELIMKADTSLYLAKAKGRNCVIHTDKIG